MTILQGKPAPSPASLRLDLWPQKPFLGNHPDSASATKWIGNKAASKGKTLPSVLSGRELLGGTRSTPLPPTRRCLPRTWPRREPNFSLRTRSTPILSVTVELHARPVSPELDRPASSNAQVQMSRSALRLEVWGGGGHVPQAPTLGQDQLQACNIQTSFAQRMSGRLLAPLLGQAWKEEELAWGMSRRLPPGPAARRQ